MPKLVALPLLVAALLRIPSGAVLSRRPIPGDTTIAGGTSILLLFYTCPASSPFRLFTKAGRTGLLYASNQGATFPAAGGEG